MNNIAGVEFSNGGMRLKSGEMKVKMPIKSMVVIAFSIIFIIILFFFLVNGIINFNFEYIFFPLLGIVGVIFLLKISPYTQSSKSYYIEFPNENSCIGLKLYYNGTQVVIPYKVDMSGKVIMDNYESGTKIDSIHFVNGTSINTRTQYKITYYLASWLVDNNLMSNDANVTFKR